MSQRDVELGHFYSKVAKIFSKLLGDHCSVVYKAGIENQVAYALCERELEDAINFSLSIPCFHLINNFKAKYETLPYYKHIIDEFNKGHILTTH